MMKKKMAFAGSWYPVGKKACQEQIDRFLAEKPLPAGRFAGGIVPHAGWYFSGAIACRVIAALASAPPVDTIVLFGGHMHPDASPFMLVHGSVDTPLGEIASDTDLAEQICDACGIQKKNAAGFPDENTFELQLPFIKYFFPNARIVMCAVPPTDAAMAIGKQAAVSAAALGRTIRVIGSTDMTHYGPDFGLTCAGTGTAAVRWVKNENDGNAINAMVAMDEAGIIANGLERSSMCCPGAAAAAAAACKTSGATRAVVLDYATSFDKSAGASFVGYSGILYAAA